VRKQRRAGAGGNGDSAGAWEWGARGLGEGYVRGLGEGYVRGGHSGVSVGRGASKLLDEGGHVGREGGNAGEDGCVGAGGGGWRRSWCGDGAVWGNGGGGRVRGPVMSVEVGEGSVEYVEVVGESADAVKGDWGVAV